MSGYVNIPATKASDVRDSQGNPTRLPGRPAQSVPVNGPIELPGDWEEVSRVLLNDGGQFITYENKFSGRRFFVRLSGIQDVVEAFPENFKKPEDRENRPRPPRGNRGGGNGGGGGGGGGINLIDGGPGGGNALDAGNATGTDRAAGRLAALDGLIADGAPGVVDAVTGELSVEARAALVDGLGLWEMSDALLARLEDDDRLIFSTQLDEAGRVFYTDGALLTGEENAALATMPTRGGMNWQTARQYALGGRLITRAAWSKKWLSWEGAWIVHSETERSLVRMGAEPDVTATDLLAEDWELPAGCYADALPVQPSFTVGAGAATGAVFDVVNPPCFVRV